RARPHVVHAALERKRPLAHGREELVDRKGPRSRIGQAQPLESGRRQDDRVDLAAAPLAEPCIDVAAQRHDLEVAPPGEQLGPPGGARGGGGSGPRRRTLAVPTRAPRGKLESAPACALSSTSWAVARAGTAPSVRPRGRLAGRSFMECTAASIVPASSASSISFTKRPFNPPAASAPCAPASPLVRMNTISTRSPALAASTAPPPPSPSPPA